MSKKLIVQAFGSNLLLMDKKLKIEPKSIFIFLRENQDQVSKEVIGSNSKLERYIDLNEAKYSQVSFGAGVGSELEPLVHLLDINSRETQLLFSQLTQLKNHIGVVVFK